MPIFDAANLNAMATQMTTAADSGEWERLAQLDVLLQRWLSEAGAHDASLSAAWQSVARAHGHAMALCRNAQQEAAQQLCGLQDTQAAQQAYAWQEILA